MKKKTPKNKSKKQRKPKKGQAKKMTTQNASTQTLTDPKTALARRQEELLKYNQYETKQTNEMVAQMLGKVAENAITILARNIKDISIDEAIEIGFKFALKFIEISEERRDELASKLKVEPAFAQAKQELINEIERLEQLVQTLDSAMSNVIPFGAATQTQEAPITN